MSKPIALVVEDDEDLSTIFGEALSAAGFEARIIRDGRTALEQLVNLEPYLVILDMHLPHISGDAILKYIRSESRFSRTTVVVVTADALMGEQAHDTADFVLIKPISFGQLRDLTMRLNPGMPEPDKE
jgi:two-component system cell cycle response regulator DivK